MSPSEDFYALLSNLLRQTAQDPDTSPFIPLKRWPAGSPEQRLLEDLQAALAVLHASSHNNLSQAKDSERQYKSVFETAGDGLIISDLENRLVIDANPATCTMYGYTRDEFIGLDPTIFILPDSFHQFTKYVKAVQSKGV